MGALEAMSWYERQPLLSRLYNITLLGLSWCMTMSGIFISIQTTTQAMTDFRSASMATLPTGLQMASSAVFLLPLSALAQRMGRRPVFVSAAMAGVAGAGVQVAAARRQSVGLLLLGAFLQGPCFSVGNNFRFVAAEFFMGGGFSPKARTRAISLTVGMAVFAAVVGPESARHARDALPDRYAASYIILVGLYLLQALFSALVDYGFLTRQAAANAAQLAAESDMRQCSTQKVAQAKLGRMFEENSVLKLSNGTSAADPSEKAEFSATFGQELDTKGGKNGQAHDNPESLPATPMQLSMHAGQPQPLLQPSSPGVSVLVALEPQQQRTVAQVLCSPLFLAPAIAGALAFCTMAACMVASPVAMKLESHSFNRITYAVEAHIVAMYLPAVVVGDCMGIMSYVLTWLVPQQHLHPSSAAIATIVMGAFVLMAACGVYLAGTSLSHFMAGMVLLGIGWALGYVAASSLVTAVFVREPHVRVAAQGVMDVLVISLLAVSNATSALLVKAMGWYEFICLYMALNSAMAALGLWFGWWCWRTHACSAPTPPLPQAISMNKPGLP